MLLEGSCHCGVICFRVRSAHSYSFNLCYCNICRKTGGGGGYAINLGAECESLEVEGDEHRSVYHAVMREGAREHVSPAERSFCALCGTSLWLWDPRWPDLVHPLASAIDTELPRPSRTHAPDARGQALLVSVRTSGRRTGNSTATRRNRWPSGTGALGSPARTDRSCRAPHSCREAGSPRPARLRPEGAIAVCGRGVSRLHRKASCAGSGSC